MLKDYFCSPKKMGDLSDAKGTSLEMIAERARF